MSGRRRDALDAVARVRRVHERDSLLGLQQARREADEAHRLMEALRAQLDAPATPGGEALAAFVARRTAFLAVERAASEAAEAHDAALAIAESAHAHWQADRVRLEAIEMLRERRDLAERAGRDRAEATRVDEVATQLWSRTRGQAAAS
ncbi:MAG: flagellar FliJ family protein [Marmoricola sp.]|nr:flagellar FliJ family protein [Marmoricola sp.]